MLTRWKNTIGCNHCGQSWHIFDLAVKTAQDTGNCPGRSDGTPCSSNTDQPKVLASIEKR